MKLKTMRVPTLALCSLILAQPAWAQSGGPANASVNATAEIREVQLNLEIIPGDDLEFFKVARPNGIVAGAQCQYTITPISTAVTQYSATEIRNGQVFDPTFPTASGCEFISGNIPSHATFVVNCSASTPVTIRAEWTSAGRQGTTLAPNPQGISNISGAEFPLNLVNNSSVTCPENASINNVDIRVLVGGTLTLDANAEIAVSNVMVGTVTLNATY